jgi:cytochrome P460
MRTLLAVAAACFLAASLGLRAQQPTQTDGPRYSGTALLRPADYREWVFLSSGLGMNYNEPAPGAPPPQRQSFTNVFVNPSSWRGFMQTGTWPDRTVLVLEIRASQGDGSINKDGRFQTTLNGLEVHVKDSRFREGWAFFGFGSGRESAEPMSGAAVASCVECHREHGAVDNTFVQFYPTLLDVARQKNTLRPGF